jgi:predicted RNA binding protein YcfA (HicA-like mRNA interferase family)
VLRAFGWQVVRKSGSHHILKKEGRRALLSIPEHGGRPISEGLLRDQLKVAGIEVDEFLQEL